MLIRAWILIVAAASCVDEPVAISPPGGGPGAQNLSDLVLFTGPPSEQNPRPGVIPYDVIAHLWSDGASKYRFVLAPAPLEATDDHWTIPSGTFLIKTFWFPHDERDTGAGIQLIETRVLAFTDHGTDEATYVWNGEQTDAETSGGNIDIPVQWIDSTGATRTQSYHVPGTSQCDTCHRGGALGLRSPQLANEIDRLLAVNVVDRAVPGVEPFVDPYADGPLEARALSYLDANCSHCHSPGGEAAGTNADWRREYALGNICRAAHDSVDGRTQIISPGAPESSVMIERMQSTDAFVHMPRGPSHVRDDAGIAMLSQWISSLKGCP